MNEAGCDLMLHDHLLDVRCSKPEHRAALERRAGGAPKWSAIQGRIEQGEFRDYLDGRAIHCGDVLELQEIEYRSDDYGEYTVPRATGVVVAYEIVWSSNSLTPGGAKYAELHTSVGGRAFVATYDRSMRFRWPQGGGR